MKDIRFYVSNQRNDLAGYEAQMRREIASAIADRRSSLTKHDNLSFLLGIPEVAPGTRATSFLATVESAAARGAKGGTKDALKKGRRFCAC
jgi:hypothetical protein